MHKLPLDAIEQPSVAELEKFPTLSVGQSDTLKREEYVDHDGNLYFVRWWVKRCGPEDGDTGAAVVVEARLCPSGSWFDVGEYGTFEAK